ncbi:MAG: hypothetical protein OSW77_12330 [Proteobacteria bacterium]|nr:hypothetical protein [Pseudomonadota bacterium]
MAVSRLRSDGSLLLLRLAVGGMALLGSLPPLLRAGVPASLPQFGQLLLNLAELLCGMLVLLGLWMPLAGGGLAVVLGWPLVRAWLHGAPLLADPAGLFLWLVVVAATLGGAGRWALGRD